MGYTTDGVAQKLNCDCLVQPVIYNTDHLKMSNDQKNINDDNLKKYEHKNI